MEVSYKKFLKQLPKYDISEPKWRLDFYESLDEKLKKTDKLNKENFNIISGKKAQFTTIIYLHGKNGLIEAYPTEYVHTVSSFSLPNTRNAYKVKNR
jgi:hypothetical protein